ncbi:excinuclease ABC subunit C [Helicobacter monodelphidis]|uniref:excinuclease ABC subunit UvrC n=1 Tax=Helicobacter sp. 15-1451 TaxID=2004995 RepID=UPI000DCEE6C2|nr:excinuclease ABC subunit UvrC [Helicobacter sp. 15-1451]RAX58433.1 excinuclease ABC subunit C [Helicobacter sp. 15-1451]
MANQPVILPQSLKKSISELPQSSGVYQYYDNRHQLLYVGKAKNLKKRVKSYFAFTPYLCPAPNLSIRISKMISQTTQIHYLLTNNEQDALILENSLIKQLKPKYNILLRDDKTFPYIFYAPFEEYPRLEITRKLFKDSRIRYFGPYTMGAKELLDSLYEEFTLVQQKSCLRGKKSCLFYQIQRCKAPCEKKITQEEYRIIFENALYHLQHPEKLNQLLKSRMQHYAKELRFEEATTLRDRIAKIQKIQHHSQIDFAKSENLDILASASQNGKILLLWLFMREGKIISSKEQILRGEHTEEELFKSAIMGHFKENIPLLPQAILLPIRLQEKTLLENYLHQIYKRKIKIITPKKGQRKELVILCQKNATESLRSQLLKSQEEENILEQIQQLFKLNFIPSRIECFDTSHYQKQAPVGAMIVYENGMLDKESYRHYRLEGQDEYTQFKEMLFRRIQSFESNPPPDLWLLDGGIAQIRIAQELLESYGTRIDVLGIAKQKVDSKAYRAKGASADIIRTNLDDFHLSPNDRRLQLLQKIRDEAHRFAITFHRKKKREDDRHIQLLEASGVGISRLKKLLQYFGSFEAISQASLEELSQVVGEKIAQNIKSIQTPSNRDL